MTNPVGPTDSPGLNLSGSETSIPPGPPLPPDNPWVKSLALLFPGAPLGELQMYAAAFQQNMFQALNTQISHDLKQARLAAQQFKESIEGDN